MLYQTEMAECGLACIAMIASFHGYKTDILTLRRHFSISLKGSRLQDLMNIARKLGLSSRAIKLELAEIKYLKTPCILHWKLDHFVVLKKMRFNSIIIHDPTVGIIKYKLSNASKYFTGIALELTPTNNFIKKTHKTRLDLLTLLGSINGLLKPLSQIILISLVLELLSILAPLLLQFVIDNVIATKDISLLNTLAIGFAMLTLIGVITSYARSWITIFLANVLNIQLVTKLVRHLLKLPLEFFQKRHMGDIVSRFSSISSLQAKISTDFIEAIVDGIMVLITFAMMLIYSYRLTLVVCSFLALYLISRLILYFPFRRLTQESLMAAAKENSIFMESIRAILPIKIFGKEAERENVWQNCYADKLNANIKPLKLALIFRSSEGICSGLEYIIIILVGANSVMQGMITVGMLLGYFAYRQQFVAKTQSLINKIFDCKLVSIELERIADIAFATPEQDFFNVAQDAAHTRLNRGISRPQDDSFERDAHSIQGQIVVKDLAFRYSEQDPYVFKNINFSVNVGETVVITGASGCGKTTLMKVMMRLLAPSSGEIFIDGISINKRGLSNYRATIAAVMQEDTLLSGSIADNICFFDQNPNEALIFNSALQAAIHDEIINMPMHYHSLVGDMGSALSGGQKQRILLARALYSQPRILFLDEATSHLDFDTEKIINQHIKKLGITRVIIAHRQETMAIADRVIKLGDAQIRG